MKVCIDHKNTAGMKRKDLEIVPTIDCELCKLAGYFNAPKNPARKTEHEVVEMSRARRLNSGTPNTKY